MRSLRRHVFSYVPVMPTDTKSCFCLSRDTSLLIYRRRCYQHFPCAVNVRFVVYPYILRFMYFVFYTTPFIFFDSFSFGKGGCARFSALGLFVVMN